MHQNRLNEILNFLRDTFKGAGKNNGLVAVSGGIDSAVSLTLLTRALDRQHVWALLLPFGNQSMKDAGLICEWNGLLDTHIVEIDIQPVVAAAAEVRGLDIERPSATDRLRLGNLMARTRMLLLYDLARVTDALVCGTENKSEKYLGYFTRFGDEASDIEPLQHLYKGQVRELAQLLALPSQFLDKRPLAGLWKGQTDEHELGFSYALADQVLIQLVDQGKSIKEITLPGIDTGTIEMIVKRVQSQKFKQLVPYKMEG